MFWKNDRPPTYWLTRFMILRLLGFVYAIAFLVAINQVLPLIGSDGLLPANLFIKQINQSIGSTAGFFKLPSIFWLGYSDQTLLIAAWIGLILSIVVMAGYGNAVLMGGLWFLYMSFVHIGQDWYSFGWEIQLTETGFLAIFLCPLIDMRPFPKRPPPLVIIFLFRWLVFRIMMGAGLIKLRGDDIWMQGTALYYHFETQPIPGPLSRWFHFLPRACLQAGVWFNWIAELVAPFFVFWPRLARHIAGLIIVLFQVNLILSGNLSFLNWLTIIPALACFDDGIWARILPGWVVSKAQRACKEAIEMERILAENGDSFNRPMIVTSWVVACLIGLLSIEPVANMLSTRQIMNTSFDPLDLVNTYGAFGSVGKERYNVVFEGTADPDSTDHSNWEQYIYKGLPVELNRRPVQIAPYQLHFDWQMWFAAMDSPGDYPWTLHLVWKLLHNDPAATRLFASDPFTNGPPRYIRAVLYKYWYARPDSGGGRYWERQRIGLWLPPLAVDDPQLKAYLKGQGWLKEY